MPDFPEEDITIEDVYAALKVMINLLSRPMWVEPGTGRVRVSDEVVATHAVTLTGTTLTSGTLTTLTQLGGFPTKDTLLNHEKKIAWSLGVRNRIT